jgi:hypothetical protein
VSGQPDGAGTADDGEVAGGRTVLDGVAEADDRTGVDGPAGR